MRCNMCTGICCQVPRSGSLCSQDSSGRFVLFKIDDQSGCGLSGAQFSLQGPDGAAQSCCSDCQGKVIFQMQPGNAYTLRETAAPPGYTRLPDAYSVVLDAQGDLQVNGLSAPGLTLANSKAITRGTP